MHTVFANGVTKGGKGPNMKYTDFVFWLLI